MRGYAEEAPEVRALSVLRRAAQRYAGEYLMGRFDGFGDHEKALILAALAYAEAVNPPPKKRVRKKVPK